MSPKEHIHYSPRIYLRGVMQLRPRLRRKRFKTIICIGFLTLVFLSCVWTFLYFKRNSSLIMLTVRCNIDDSILFIQELCHDYSKGFVSGSFCDPLCSSSDVTVRDCMGHKGKEHIILAEWNGENVVLKADADLSSTTRIHFGYLSKEQRASYNLSTEMFLTLAASSLKYNMFGQKENPETKTLAQQILAECKQGEDDTLSFVEALYCFHLIDEQEIMLTLALQGVSGIPKLFGACGNLYAVEFASTASLAGVPLIGVFDPRSWEFKVKLAVALIEMIESFELTRHGVLYNCDVQEPNFGFVVQGDRFVAKSIDSDFSMLEDLFLKTLEFESNNSCVVDKDCDFLDCKIPCDKESGTCSGRLVSNNLQVVCLDLFLPSTKQPFPFTIPSLLGDPPADIKVRLSELLQECANPTQPSNRSSLLLAHRLKTLLRDSIY